MTNYNPVAVIPHYNHSSTVEFVKDKLSALGLPVLIVDDGSTEEHRRYLKLLEERDNLQVLYREQNGGKGAALKTGFEEALKRGFTHIVQVDADAQHRIEDALIMLQKSREKPTALICGRPVYGEDAPKSRLYGRKITNFWIAVNTLSTDIQDGMCGFRVYPLAQVNQF